MDSNKKEMSVTKVRKETTEEQQGFDRSIKESNFSRHSESFQNKCADESETLSSNLELKKTRSNNLEQTNPRKNLQQMNPSKNLEQPNPSKNLEQTTHFTAPQPLPSVLRSCQQACSIQNTNTKLRHYLMSSTLGG